MRKSTSVRVVGMGLGIVAIAANPLLITVGAGMSAIVLVSTSAAYAATLTDWTFDPTTHQLEVTLPVGVTPRYFLLAQPARIVLDLPNTDVGVGVSEQTYAGAVRQVRVSQFEPGTARIVLELSPNAVLAPGQVALQQLNPGAEGDARWALRPLLADGGNGIMQPAIAPTVADSGTTLPLGSQGTEAEPAGVANWPTSPISEGLAAVPPGSEPSVEARAAEFPESDEAIAPLPAVPGEDISTPAIPLPPATEESHLVQPIPATVDAPQSAPAVSLALPPEPSHSVDRPSPQEPLPLLPPAEIPWEPSTPAPMEAPLSISGQNPSGVGVGAASGAGLDATDSVLVGTGADLLTTQPAGNGLFGVGAPSEPDTVTLPPLEPGGVEIPIEEALVSTPEAATGVEAIAPSLDGATLPPALPNDSPPVSIAVPSMTTTPAEALPLETAWSQTPGAIAPSLPDPAPEPAPSMAMPSVEAESSGAGQPDSMQLAAVTQDTAILLPSGTAMTLRYPRTTALTLEAGQPWQEVLVLEQSVLDPQGRIVFPAGSLVLGRFETTSAGSQFIVQAIDTGGQTILLRAESSMLAGDRQPPEQQQLFRNSAIGLVGAGLLGILTGGIGLLGLAAGAATGAATTYLSAPQPATIEPNQIVEVRLSDDLPRLF